MNYPSSRYFYGGEQGIFPRLPPLSPRFARCHRRQKQSTGLFSSESLWLSPSLFESLLIIKKQNHPKGWFCFLWRRARDFSEAVASLASLRSLPPSAKTVHRTVFFRKPLPFSLLVRIPFHYKKTKPPQRMVLFFMAESKGFEPSNRL